MIKIFKFNILFLLLVSWSIANIILPTIEDSLLLGRFLQLCYFIFYFLAFNSLLKKNNRSNEIIKMLIFWSIYVSIINIINISNSPFSYIEVLKDTLWWPCIFIVFFDFFNSTNQINYLNYIRKYFLLYFLIISSLIIYLIIFYSGNTDLNAGVVNQNEINSIYWILFILPFCFYQSNKIKYLIFLITLMMIVISSKRSPLIAFGIILSISLFRDYFNLNFKNILIGFLSVIIMIFTVNKLSENISINSSERLISTNLVDEPRFIFILDSWQRFNSKSNINKILGSGHRASAIDRGGILSKTTHNDFFETLYSYGLVGFVLYIYIFFLIFKRLYKFSKKDKIFYEAHLSSLIIFLIISMLSHLNMYPTYFAFLIIVWTISEIKIINN